LPVAGQLKTGGQEALNAAADKQGQSSHLNTLLAASFSDSNLSPGVAETANDSLSYSREVLRQIVANLGFPQDTLSLALLTFARYFSLPIKPGLIRQLRREILDTGKASSPETTEGKAALDSQSMAAVIAVDKGLVLNSEALSRYAAFLLPPLPGGEKKEERKDREESPESEELQAIAEEQTQKDDLLSFLNSIPGKNGQFWMVFPFSIKVRGTELNVFLRLLKKEQMPAKDGEELILDISGPKRQWRCFLRKISGKFHADIQVYPKLSSKGLTFARKEAGRFLGDFADIQVRNGDKTPSWAEDLSSLCLPSIDKNV